MIGWDDGKDPGNYGVIELWEDELVSSTMIENCLPRVICRPNFRPS